MTHRQGSHVGPETTKALLPHRHPLLLVDRVLSVDPASAAIEAVRHISANEPVFAGHFPHLSIWPGVYTIEGLGQSSQLLQTILRIKERAEANGRTWSQVLNALQAYERGLLSEGTRYENDDQAAKHLLLDVATPTTIGLSGAVDIRFYRPVLAGERLHYHVRRTHIVDDCARFETIAKVDGTCVARGTLTGSLPVRRTSE